MWKEKLGWDETLPPSLQENWLYYREQMPTIEKIQIPRLISQDQPQLQQLHGFCDASESAYAAVVFLRSLNAEGDVLVRMVAAKSKVAPLKQVSLPRLELCGAVLLVRLLQCIQEALKIQMTDVFGWTDSTIVLSWLASPPHRWKTFVANRVSEIQDFLPRETWRHVKSEDNPADCASRGIPHSQLVEHHLWWNGPDWLSEKEIPSFLPVENTPASPLEERSLTKALHVIQDDSLLFRYSELSKLLRITAYCQRAIDRMRRRRVPTTYRDISLMSTTVTSGEMNRAMLTWVKIVQQSEFNEEDSAHS